MRIICVSGKLEGLEFKQLLPENSLVVRLETKRLVVVLQDSRFDVEKISASLLGENSDINLGISEEVDKIHEGYIQADSCIVFLDKLNVSAHVKCYEDISFYADMIVKKGEHQNRLSVIHPLKEHLELFETLKVYLLKNQDMKSTSNILNIHRNTLKYRLKRIHQLTSKNPESILELFELLHGILTDEED